MRNRWMGLITLALVFALATGCRRTPDKNQDRADIEQVFHTYVQSINAADVSRASQVWLQSPDLLVVTPFGRLQGWDAVKEMYANLQRDFTKRNIQVSNVSLVVAGDVAWLVYDFDYTATRTDGRPLSAKGWESHGYQRTPNGWRIAQLHYSVPPPPM